MKDFKIAKFQNDDFIIDVKVDIADNTVWLTQKQMAELFNVSVDNISLHIKNILKDNELDNSTIEESSEVRLEGKRYIKRKLYYYNLDMIISVGYRVKSKNGILFRRWASHILKKYLLDGYALNKERLDALNRTFKITTKMLSSSLNIDEDELLNVLKHYTKALDTLDNYDHSNLKKSIGNKPIYKLSYEEAIKIIKKLSFSFNSDVFGKEKEVGKLNGILEAIEQTAFGKDLYESVQDKASHLLYFLVKDHPFVDGCKRIAATLFLEYLYKNQCLYVNNKPVISNDALVSVTILVAESKPEEMNIMITLINNLLLF